MDRRYLGAALTTLLWAQLSQTEGLWSRIALEQPFGKKFSVQALLQPRFIPLPPQRCDMVVVQLQGWYRRGTHRFAVEPSRAWIEYPRRATQWRARLYWAWLPSPRLQTQLRLEYRWEGPHPIERMVRPQVQYLWPVSSSTAIGLREEGLFYGWNPIRGWHLGVRQSRSWLFLAWKTRNVQFEAGYLLLAAPRTLPRHRFWLAVRWSPVWPLTPPGSDKAGPVNEAQTPPPE